MMTRIIPTNNYSPSPTTGKENIIQLTPQQSRPFSLKNTSERVA